MICKHFLPFCGLFFSFLIVPFGAKKFLILMTSKLLFLWLLMYFRIHVHDDSCLFSSKNFIIFSSFNQSLIHFELISVYGIK
jgi:hypothetical protein